MDAKRKVEVFSAGCGVCEEATEIIKRVTGSTCEVVVHNMKDVDTAKRAKALGIRSVPAIVIDGELAACCAGRGVDEAILRAAALGRST